MHNTSTSVALIAAGVLALCMNGVAAEFFVATNGCDAADGSAARPWRTIQRAADVAMAGDVVTIRGGVYREWVKPVNAGRADAPITYQAAKGEKVVVTGADPVRGWTRRPDGLWMAKVRYDSCQGMNPFKDYISGDWFSDRGHYNLRSWLIQGGKPLKTHAIDYFWGQNALNRQLVLNVDAIYSGSRKMPGFGKKSEHTYATSNGYDFSTPEARRLAFRDAGPNWASGNGEQLGVVGTHWSRGWVIEDCEVSGSSCVGISLGKYGDEWDNAGPLIRGQLDHPRRMLEG